MPFGVWEFMISSRKPQQTFQIYCVRNAYRGLKDSKRVLLYRRSSRSALAHSLEEKLHHFQVPESKGEGSAGSLPSPYDPDYRKYESASVWS